jgi:predicted GIY-YIG superfamily endonuclease
VIWSIYAYYDGDVCIYVGCTRNMRMRDNAHKAASLWWTPELDLRELAFTDTEVKGNRMEREAIARLRPLHNVRMRPRKDAA